MDGGYFHRYKDKNYNNHKRANCLDKLIIDELNGKGTSNYLRKIFHKICETRSEFAVKKFMKYVN